MRLETGQRLGDYEIVDSLGAGGMGEVYRARDRRLGREVALKVLPAALAEDAERLARFEREARVLASLNHPNVATLYGLHSDRPEGAGAESVELPWLTMELVEGEDLSERLKRGTLSLDEALPIFLQIARGLEAAHERGVVHRDLKPANVKVRENGEVKVLDFGLAKALVASTASGDLSESPTMTAMATARGEIMGTAAYMSPEQARGKTVDKRADIWAFGCVLYEALVGERLFRGETATDVLAAVLTAEPQLERLEGRFPPRLLELLRRCLAKNPAQRLHDIADARLELETIREEPWEAGAVSSRPAASGVARWLPWALVAALLLVVAALAFRRPEAAPRATGPVSRFEVALPADTVSTDNGFVVVAQDGTRFASSVVSDGRPAILVRDLDRPGFEIPVSAERAGSIFFSPDGEWLAYFADGRLWKVATEGGRPIELTTSLTFASNGTWSERHGIVYNSSYESGLLRLAAEGGEPEQLTMPDRESGELGHWSPELLPGGDWVLFTSYRIPPRIEALHLESGERRIVLEDASHGQWVDSGHLVFARRDRLMAVRFDAERLTTSGEAVPVLDEVSLVVATNQIPFDLSANGVVVAVPATVMSPETAVVSVDRAGNRVEILLEGDRYRHPALSPDGRRLVVLLGPDLWLADLQRGTRSRLSFGPGLVQNPRWTPDGARVIYQREKPQFDVVWSRADGSGEEETLLTSPYDKWPQDVSADGSTLVFAELHPETGADLWQLSIADGERTSIRVTPFVEDQADLSPDGRYLVYRSDESGRSEVYLETWPIGGGRWQLSVGGGQEPRWSKDGREVFYRGDGRFWSVAIADGADPRPGTPTALFDDRYADKDNYQPDWDLGPGDRFVVFEPVGDPGPPRVDVIVNWQRELERILP